MSDDDREPAEVSVPGHLDIHKANIARVYDSFLGGKNNYAADREVHRQILTISPNADQAAREHRQWLVRVVRFLAGEAGVDQFLDCGSGLPTAQNTHEVAQEVNPDARVVYVDNDPVVAAHGRALLEVNKQTWFAEADLTSPEQVLRDPGVTAHLDLSRPLALIQCATLHHIEDEQHPTEIMARYIDALAPGSYVAVAHWFRPQDGGELDALATSLEKTFRGSSMATTRFRTRDEIASFFAGLELVEPGLVNPYEWRPDGTRTTPVIDLFRLVLSGVGRKP